MTSKSPALRPHPVQDGFKRRNLAFMPAFGRYLKSPVSLRSPSTVLSEPCRRPPLPRRRGGPRDLQLRRSIAGRLGLGPMLLRQPPSGASDPPQKFPPPPRCTFEVTPTPVHQHPRTPRRYLSTPSQQSHLWYAVGKEET